MTHLRFPGLRDVGVWLVVPGAVAGLRRSLRISGEARPAFVARDAEQQEPEKAGSFQGRSESQVQAARQANVGLAQEELRLRMHDVIHMTLIIM